MKILDKVSKEIQSLKPYEPGRPIEDVARELGLDPDTISKLASNESGLGPSPLAMAALKEALDDMHRYPDGGAFLLKERLSKTFDMPADSFIIGNGSNEILELVGHCFLNPNSSAVFSDYAFVVYRLVSVMFGAEMIIVPTKEGFISDLDAIYESIREDTSVVFLCSPSNPTGRSISPEAFDAFMDKVPEHVLVVMDEAYAEIALCPQADSLSYVREKRPIIVTRTFSKAYGLAGLRIGYGIAAPEIIHVLNQARQPFNVNLAAQVAATAALDDTDFVSHCISLYREAKAYIEGECTGMSLEFVPSDANFMLIKVGDGDGVFKEMQTLGLIVRPMSGYGLADYIRISYGTMDENRRFIAGLKKCLDK
ncbi:MAG: histidinol-phosphate transaminase [Lentisphaeria bacterium]|nr:histidinol-phosphate transaminase [Lentisphaeria bacterium]NQZ70511.1 histidinol-phosphate transaminase [Lentisphaeria bacterium]